MDELSAHLKAVTRIAIFFLSICFILWTGFPDFRGYALGLIIGTGASLINMRYLSMKVRQAADIAEAGQKRRFNLGFLTRAAIGVLAVMLAIRLGNVELFGVIIGLLFWQVASLLLGILSIFRK
jgi:ATP synthase protein I